MGNNLFVFGAGTSLSAGYPLGSNLLVDVLSKSDQKEFEDELNIVRGRVAALCPAMEKANFEEYLSLCVQTKYFPILRTKLRLEHGLDYDLLEMLREYFVRIYNDRKKYNWSHHANFVKNHYKKSDVIITFNYDWVIEKVIQEDDRKLSVNCQPWQYDGVTVLRPHGCCAWVQGIPGNKIVTSQLEPEKIKFSEYVERRARQLVDAEGLIWYLPTSMIHLKDENGRTYSPSIVPPIWYKGVEIEGLKTERFFRDCWQRSCRELEAASKVYVLGFSFSDPDLWSRIYFRYGLHDKGENSVFFVNPEVEHFNNFKEKIFSNAVHIKEDFETFSSRPELP